SGGGRLRTANLGLMTAGIGGIAQGHAREAYQQKKINARRKELSRKRTTGPPTKVTKRSRVYDPEDRRQRRLAAAATATTIGGGLLLHRGAKQVMARTSSLRQAGRNLAAFNKPGAHVGYLGPKAGFAAGKPKRKITETEKEAFGRLGSKTLIDVGGGAWK